MEINSASDRRLPLYSFSLFPFLPSAYAHARWIFRRGSTRAGMGESWRDVGEALATRRSFPPFGDLTGTSDHQVTMADGYTSPARVPSQQGRGTGSHGTDTRARGLRYGIRDACVRGIGFAFVRCSNPLSRCMDPISRALRTQILPHPIPFQLHLLSPPPRTQQQKAREPVPPHRTSSRMQQGYLIYTIYSLAFGSPNTSAYSSSSSLRNFFAVCGRLSFSLHHRSLAPHPHTAATG